MVLVRFGDPPYHNVLENRIFSFPEAILTVFGRDAVRESHMHWSGVGVTFFSFPNTSFLTQVNNMNSQKQYYTDNFSLLQEN